MKGYIQRVNHCIDAYHYLNYCLWKFSNVCKNPFKCNKFSLISNWPVLQVNMIKKRKTVHCHVLIHVYKNTNYNYLYIYLNVCMYASSPAKSYGREDWIVNPWVAMMTYIQNSHISSTVYIFLNHIHVHESFRINNLP